MKNDIKLVVCDVDGTLLKPDGKTLQKGVAKFVKALYEQQIPVMFISGKNYAEIDNFINIVCEKAGIEREEFHPIIASNNGAYVEDSASVKTVDKVKTLSPKQMERINEIVAKVDPSALVVYKTINNNYIDRARDAKGLIAKIKKAGVKTIKDVLVAMRKFDLKALPLSAKQIDNAVKDRRVLSLNILSFKCPEIAEELGKELPNLSSSPSGVYIDLSTADKFEVVSTIAKQMQLKKENIACFGDSTNDEKMLLESGSLRFLCNLKPKRTDLFTKITSKSGGYATDDLSDPTILKAVTGKAYSKQMLSATTEKVKERLKFEKQPEEEKTLK